MPATGGLECPPPAPHRRALTQELTTYYCAPQLVLLAPALRDRRRKEAVRPPSQSRAVRALSCYAPAYWEGL